MDGSDEDVNGDNNDNDNDNDNDNRVMGRNMVAEQVVANNPRIKKSAASSRKQGQEDSSSSLGNVPGNTSHANRADGAETVDDGTGPTSPARKIKNPVDESLDISDSSESGFLLCLID